MQEENFFGDSDSDQDNIQKQLQNKVNAAKDSFDEDLMGDAEDRQHLAGLTELEREKILMERHAKRQEF
jgi:hypothetical protein